MKSKTGMESWGYASNVHNPLKSAVKQKNREKEEEKLTVGAFLFFWIFLVFGRTWRVWDSYEFQSPINVLIIVDLTKVSPPCAYLSLVSR